MGSVPLKGRSFDFKNVERSCWLHSAQDQFGPFCWKALANSVTQVTTGLSQFLESLWVAGLGTFLRTHAQLNGGWRILQLPVNGWERATSINPEIANLDSFLRTIYHFRRPSSFDSHGFYDKFLCIISSLPKSFQSSSYSSPDQFLPLLAVPDSFIS